MSTERIRVQGESVKSLTRVCGKLEVIALENDTLVLKEAGRHYYSGQGKPWSYAGAQFRVYRVEKREPVIYVVGTPKHKQVPGVVLSVALLTSWPVRA